MTAPDPDDLIDEEPAEGDLTTTAQVLAAREILDRLESDAEDQHAAKSSRHRTRWWRRLLSWVGLA